MAELPKNTLAWLARAGQHAERKGPDEWIIAGDPDGRIMGAFMHGATISSTTRFAPVVKADDFDGAHRETPK